MRGLRSALYLGLLFVGLASGQAHAVPGFARQMGTQCSTCHTVFPQLNAFGRQFKLNGYQLGEASSSAIESQNDAKRTTLALSRFPPLSVMLQTAFTTTAKSLPATQNDNWEFPQEASLFIAGAVAPNLGSYVQFTYSQEDAEVGLDMAELRYAKTGTIAGKPVTYGGVVNNAPSMEDLWNTTPVWGFPWSGPDSGASPIAAPLIDDGLAQDVLGAGAYALVDGSYYAAMTLYDSAHLGSVAPTGQSENTIDGVAPYWRLAWQHAAGEQYLEVGTYGLRANLFPRGVSGATDRYSDVGFDAQYERPLGSRTLRVHGTFLREDQSLDASVLAGDAALRDAGLDTLRLDAGIYMPDLAFIVGHVRVDGDPDPVRFGPEAVNGSLSGEPDQRAWVAEAIYSPWENVQLRLQYTAYDEFNGGRRNYDGFGRNASDNNTLFLQAWLAW